MSQRAFQKFSICKAVAKNSFEYPQIGAHVRVVERKTYGLAPAPFLAANSVFFDWAICLTDGGAVGSLKALSSAAFASSNLPPSMYACPKRTQIVESGVAAISAACLKSAMASSFFLRND